MSDDFTPQPCDGCTACCKLLGVKSISKPANTWCAMCDIGKGCNAYDSRPPECGDFACAYAKGFNGSNTELRPDKTKVVFSFTKDGAHVVAYVDPGRPDAWKEGPAGHWFAAMIAGTGKGIVVIGKKRIAIGEGWVAEDVSRALSQDVH